MGGGEPGMLNRFINVYQFFFGKLTANLVLASVAAVRSKPGGPYFGFSKFGEIPS